MKHKDKYDQIAKLAEWVNDNRFEVAGDGMNVIIAIADDKKIRRMCLTGNSMELSIMIQLLLKSASDEYDKVMSQKEQ